MTSRFLKPWLIALACLAMPSAQAIEVGGIHFEEQTRLDGHTLALNGAGLRTKLFFKVYAMGLYLETKGGTADTVIADPAPKRIRIVTLRDLRPEQFADALVEGIRKNHGDEEVKALEARISTFRDQLLGAGATREGTEVLLDYLPQSGTRLTVGGEARGATIPGADFHAAVLRVWLGREPADAELKSQLVPGGH